MRSRPTVSFFVCLYFVSFGTGVKHSQLQIAPASNGLNGIG